MISEPQEANERPGDGTRGQVFSKRKARIGRDRSEEDCSGGVNRVAVDNRPHTAAAAAAGGQVRRLGAERACNSSRVQTWSASSDRDNADDVRGRTACIDDELTRRRPARADN